MAEVRFPAVLNYFFELFSTDLNFSHHMSFISHHISVISHHMSAMARKRSFWFVKFNVFHQTFRLTVVWIEQTLKKWIVKNKLFFINFKKFFLNVFFVKFNVFHQTFRLTVVYFSIIIEYYWIAIVFLNDNWKIVMILKWLKTLRISCTITTSAYDY